MPGGFLIDEWVRQGATINSIPTPPNGMPLSNLLDPQPRVRTRLPASYGALILDLGQPRAIDVLGVLSSTLRNETVAWRVGAKEAVIEPVAAMVFHPIDGPGALPPGLTSGRTGETGSGNATIWDVTGSLVAAAPNAIRETYDPTTLACEGILAEPARTNSVRNPRAEGAVVKLRGDAPTNWYLGSSVDTVDWKILGTGTDVGIPYVDIQIYGTTNEQPAAFYCYAEISVNASQGQIWTASTYYKLISGSLYGITCSQRLIEADSSGNWLSNISYEFFAPDSTLRRTSTTRTFTNAATQLALSPVYLFFPTNATISAVIRLGGPQLEQAASVTAYENTTGAAGTRNQIRNASGGGAVAGNKGTAPTNWGANGFGGVEVELVGTGIESGMPYVDLRAFGTAAGGAGAMNVLVEPFTAIVAASGQAWCSSFYVKRVAGALPGGATYVRTTETTAAGVLVGVETDTGFVLASPVARLSASRASAARLLSGGATVARTNGQLVFIFANGPVDLTVRVACPQIEQGSFPTMPILPPVGSPGATSRMQDYIYGSVPSSSSYTLFFEARHGAGNPASPTAYVWVNNGISSDHVAQSYPHAGSTYKWYFYRNIEWVPAALGFSGTFSAGAVQRVAIAGGPTEAAAVVNGSVAATSSQPMRPMSVVAIRADDTVLFVRRLAFYGSRLTNGQMVALTSYGGGVSTLDDAARVYYAEGPASASDESNGNFFQVLPQTVTARYVRLDVLGAPVSGCDIGNILVGSMWRSAFAPAYGLREGRIILDQRDQNPYTGAQFPVPAVANPRTATFTLPVKSTEVGSHRELLLKLGAARDTLWIPDGSLDAAELAKRALWGAVASPGDEAALSRSNYSFHERAFRIIERL